MTLKEAADRVLTEAQEAFANHNGTPLVRAVAQNDDIAKISVPGFFMEDAGLKTVLFRTLGETARVTDTKYLIIATDAWTLDMSPAQQQRRLDDEAYRAAFEKATKENGLVAAAAAGFGELVEIIQVSAQAKHDFIQIVQPYERVADDGVIPPSTVRSGIQLPDHKIRFSKAPTIITGADGRAEGRIITFYEGPEKTDA